MEEKEFYTIEELADMFECSTRTIQRHIKSLCDNLSKKEKNKQIPINIAIEIAKVNDYYFEREKNGQPVVEEYYFTESEYNEFYKRLEEYPHLKEKIETLREELNYRKKEVEKLQDKYFEHMDKFFTTIEQRNYIEAKREIKN